MYTYMIADHLDCGWSGTIIRRDDALTVWTINCPACTYLVKLTPVRTGRDVGVHGFTAGLAEVLAGYSAEILAEVTGDDPHPHASDDPVRNIEICQPESNVITIDLWGGAETYRITVSQA